MLVGGDSDKKKILNEYFNKLLNAINEDINLDIENWDISDIGDKNNIIKDVVHIKIKNIIKKLQDGYNIDRKKSELNEIETKLNEINDEIALSTLKVEQSKRLIDAFSGMPFILLKERISASEFNWSDEILQEFIKKHYHHHEKFYSSNLGFSPESYKLKKPVRYITDLSEPNMEEYIKDVITAINKYNKSTTTEGGRKNRQKRRTTTKKGRSTKRRTTTKKRR